MDTAQWVAIGLFAISTLFGIIGILFNKTDNRQESTIVELKKEIVILHEKNNTTFQTLIGEYVKRSEFDMKIQRLESDISGKLDKILDKLERKADRQ